MENDRSESYILMNMQAFLQIGGNVSSYGGVILFDNYEEPAGGAASQMPFGSNPMKLQYHVLVVCKTGSLKLRLECNRPLNLKGGDIVFLRQGQIVEFLGSSDTAKVMFIAVSTDHIINLSRFMPHLDCCQSSPVTPSQEFLDDIHIHYALMKKCIQNTASVFCNDILNLYVHIVLMKLGVAYNERDRERLAATRQHEIYRRFVTLVKHNFKRHRNVEFYASSLFISSGHLSRIIKSMSGKTVGVWIRDYVVLEAKIMLQSSDLTISQISDYLSFTTPSFFSKYFRENTGMTPGQYRKKYEVLYSDGD